MFKKFKLIIILFLAIVMAFNFASLQISTNFPLRAAPLKSKAGINDGLGFGSETATIPFINGTTIDPDTSQPFTPDLNMQFILEIATNKNDVTGAVNFVNNSSSAGFVPIIRLCYVGGCNFTSSADMSTYYSSISDQINPESSFVAVLGPNEPGSAGEMEAFGLTHGDYTSLVNWANTAATVLQSRRVVNGGNIYLAPVIFNGTNTSLNSDDVKGYLYQTPTIDPLLFDYLLANEYDVAGQTMGHFYDEAGRSVRQYIVANPTLKAIISEAGFFSPATISSFSSSYLSLCQDSTVNGILFFRPFDPTEIPSGYPNFTPKQSPPISLASLKSVIDSCGALPTITCASYTYTDWGVCTSGTQTRTVSTTFPVNCSGGTAPVLSQSCSVEGSVICGNVDSNDDHFVSIIDFAHFAYKYLHTCSDTSPTPNSCGAVDSNGDNEITIIDFASFAFKYQQSC